MKCKFPDRPCSNRFELHTPGKAGLYCRLVEWKRKKGVCPYDHNIQSYVHLRKRRVKGQQQLGGII